MFTGKAIAVLTCKKFSFLPALQHTTPLKGVSVLELGSGVGLSGITCAMFGAITTLTDWGAGGVAAALNPEELEAFPFKNILF